ncbi:outer membrane-stress sensor serine endopeptidase DegS [Neiella marina]|uniref:Outer membrane-stress sensor serine endopeptidase DegS n=1 Tax=Neiella holothuriorum TaxID=2870530 RepID=A0ABS7ECN0_9GAMM|nr:outer membrane-stress sensor serine endopeptidase DegS [Neiella holothuriorum]MBW8189487.1 outer membrane-stress sensor serine endopeptidase DegS [Neiella holothuriorum]
MTVRALQYLLKASLGGLLLAALLLVLFPGLRGANTLVDAWLPTTNGSQTPYSLATAVRKASPAVVNVYSRNLERSGSLWSNKAELRTKGLGSGVLMTEKGHILTNSHVVQNADQILVALQDGRIYSAKLIGQDIFTDLAVLHIEDDNLPVIPQIANYTPDVGELVLAIGNPYNLGQTITQGIISAAGRSGMASTNYQHFLQTDAAINRGNSGGALVNSEGVLLGINTAAFQAGQEIDIYGISFAVPYALARKVMESIIKHGRVIRGYLGITGESISSTTARQLRLGDRSGVRVTAMEPSGPAQSAGLMMNDIILKIDGRDISEVNMAMDSIAETEPGFTVHLTILRQGQLITVPVVVSEPPIPPQLQR